MLSGLTFILAEAALELVPDDLLSHPSVAKHALRLRRKPAHTLLDRSVHHRAMLDLPEAHKRGRPDIVHLALLEVTDSPLYMEGQVDVYMHTMGDVLISLGKNLRLPKSYHRFDGLMVNLLTEGEVRGPENQTLMAMEKSSLEELIRKSNLREIVGLSRHGEQSSYPQVARTLLENRPSAFVVGGFPRGRFSARTQSLFTRLLAVDARPLEAHVVLSRQAYEIEKMLTQIARSKK